MNKPKKSLSKHRASLLWQLLAAEQETCVILESPALYRDSAFGLIGTCSVPVLCGGVCDIVLKLCQGDQ